LHYRIKKNILSNPVLNRKLKIGFTCGDTNGIGTELIIKSLSDNRILEFCTPIVFASNKLINFYRKTLPDLPFNYSSLKDFNSVNHKQINIYNCWQEEIAVEPGELNKTGGDYAVKSLLSATEALKNGSIDAIVTSPIHKNNVHGDEFPFTGHTPFFKAYFEATVVKWQIR
jgi:4-hydroxythreonine-4-phosphate dehydrogenase